MLNAILLLISKSNNKEILLQVNEGVNGIT